MDIINKEYWVEKMHWADVEALNLIKRGGPIRIATGITPSGHIHVGNMREIITGDAVYRALLDRGEKPQFIYMADSFDPLRKVYPFLDASYEKYIGHPISEIPCPCGAYVSYVEHFQEPFLQSVLELGIKPEVKYVHQMYKDGLFYEGIKKLIEGKDIAREILERVTGRQLKRSWFPYLPKCSACNTFANTTVDSFEDPYVAYTCSCGNNGKADIRTDEGKLPWRLEWPARWSFLGISCEPFGKDHAAAGGSYESASEIMEKILGGKTPHPVIYEWIQLKGKGAMSSSTGVVITGVDMLNMTPAEVLRFMVMRVDPPKHIDFDPGFGILNLVDEYDRYEEIFFGVREGEKSAAEKKRIFEISQVDTRLLEGPGAPRRISYRHLVSLVQIDPSLDEVLKRLKRTENIEELTEDDIARIEKRLNCARFWLDNFAPDSVRFSLQEHFKPSMIEGFGDLEFKILKELEKGLSSVPWKGSEIHQACYDVKERLNISPKKVFSLLYRLLLDQNRGPRLGFFLSSLDRKDVLKRLREAITAVH